MGQWLNGVKQGLGVWHGGKGEFYVGEWLNGYANGFGWHVWRNGDK